MLKIIGRMVWILLAAGIICGGLYWYANHAGASLGGLRGAFRGELRARPALDSASGLNGLPTRPDGDFDHDGGEGGSIFNAIGILVNLGKVAGITALVVLVQWIGRKIARRRSAAAPTA